MPKLSKSAKPSKRDTFWLRMSETRRKFVRYELVFFAKCNTLCSDILHTESFRLVLEALKNCKFAEQKGARIQLSHFFNHKM